MLVRPYQRTDIEPVRKLLTRTFGTSEIFDRFAVGNPLGEFVAVVAVSAEAEGTIVGFNIWNPWLVQTSAGPVIAYQSGASAVDESMRGRGVFGQLLRAGESVARGRGVEMLFGFPNPASLPAFVKGGWDHALSLRIFVSPLPSIGLGCQTSAAPTADVTTSMAARFVAWRYARAGVTGHRAELRDGRTVTLYARTERRMGARVNKLLDVVDHTGQRVTDTLGAIGARLPGPGVNILRAVTPPPGLPPWLHVRRNWETPLILKRLIDGVGPDYAAFRNASYWYGDIDAS